MSDSALLQKKARFGRLATVALLALLMAFMAAEAMLEPLATAPMLFLIAVLLLPLSFFLVPIWRGRVQSAIWLSLFLMPYFCWAVLGSFVPGTDGRLALARSLIIAACFTAAMLMARWQRAADASANP